MRAARITLRALAVLIAVYGAVALCWRPYVCNVATVKLTAAARAAIGGDPGARLFLRDHVDDALACLHYERDNVDLSIVVGTAYSLAERYDDALAVYEGLLRYQRRPEIYYNIGILQNKLGHREQAIESLAIAGRFNRAILEPLSDEPLRLAVLERLDSGK